ncbi:MAG TPA: glycosyltransferase family 4 protein [Gaiellaceae bacterium]
MKLIFATQKIDASHPTLGAAADMVTALAARFDEVVVLASEAGSLPANARFRSFAAPTQLLRGARFEAALAQEVLRGRPDGFLAHMSPVYALLAAPVLKPLRVPVLLWFTQQRGGRNFHRSVRIVDAILSVDERSAPVSSQKIRAIGHGIDTDAFECNERPRRDGLHLLSLGRYAEVKGHDVAIRALPAFRGAQLTVRGEEATRNDARVRARLAELVRELGLEDRVQLLDAVPRVEVPSLLAEADVLVNATHGTTADKVVFEALASCLPVVAASPVFDRLLPAKLRFTDGDPAGLASAIRAAMSLSWEERRRLRARVEAEHSVEHWADAVVSEVRR